MFDCVSLWRTGPFEEVRDGFSEAVRTVFGKYATFDKRAGRSEYWYWVLFVVIASVVLSIVDGMLGLQMNGSGIISSLFGLAVLLPSLAAGARRLHDIGKSGWNLLFGLIPLLGAIYLIYLYVQPSNPGSNAYGSQPTGTVAAMA